MPFSFSVSTVTSIGAAEVRVDNAAAYVVSVTSDTYDWTVRGAVPAAIRAALGVDADSEPAQKVGPKGAQRTTNYGRGFDTLSKRIARLVKGEKETEGGVIRLSLSGEGGVTITLRPGDAGYEDAAALIAASAPAE